MRFLIILFPKWKMRNTLPVVPPPCLDWQKPYMNLPTMYEKYYTSSSASLSGLAKTIHESPHHVSQVINEKLGQSFFELLAVHRVKEAQVILKTDLGKKLTIEEVAERVGYNSKSAFNAAFKKITAETPSSFRNS